MSKKDDKKKKEKEPIDMDTDEALDYVFGTEIAEELKRQARQDDDDREIEEPGN